MEKGQKFEGVVSDFFCYSQFCLPHSSKFLRAKLILQLTAFRYGQHQKEFFGLFFSISGLNADALRRINFLKNYSALYFCCLFEMITIFYHSLRFIYSGYDKVETLTISLKVQIHIKNIPMSAYLCSFCMPRVS